MADIYRDLARELRGRRVSESEIASVLARASRLAHTRGVRAEDVIGDPATFAKETPRGRTQSFGVRLISVLAVVATVIVVGAAIDRYLLHVSKDVFGLWPSVVALGLVGLGFFGGFASDSRSPRGFKPSGDGGEVDAAADTLP